MSALGGKIAGTVLALNRGTVPVENPNPAALPHLTKDQLRRETQLIVLSFPIKQCAEQQGGATTRAVESQRQGDSSMSLLAAANLSRSNPRARAGFARLFGFSGPCTDPDFMEGIEKVANYYWDKQQQLVIDQAPALGDHQSDLFGGGK